MNRRKLLFVALGSLPAIGMFEEAQAQVGPTAGTLVRREYHEDIGNFRCGGEVLAPGFQDPYWAWLEAMEETMKAPNTGMVSLFFTLVTDDGKPVTEARWTRDNRLPLDQWEQTGLIYGPNGWQLNLDLRSQCRVGVNTIHFMGAIKGGRRNYTKVWVIVDITIGGRRKKRYMCEALQFLVYKVDDRDAPFTPVLLSNMQEAMGAGGSSLLAPRVSGNNDAGDSGNGKTQDAQPSQVDRTVEIRLEGISAWIRLVGDNNVQTETAVVGTQSVKVPKGCNSYNCYVLLKKADGTKSPPIPVKNRGQEIPFPASTRTIRIAAG